MKRELDRLAEDTYDLFIIGGGISGACLAWDASLRGLRVALADKADFGSATSSATSKLIHGGLRYLKNAEFGLVRESLRERRILQTVAGHLVRPVPFMIPTYKRGNRKWMIKAGMVMYDTLSYDRDRLDDPDQRLPGHQMLSPARVREIEPGVCPEKLTGGAIYYDCECEPDRLTFEFLLGAAGRGAVLVNHAEVCEIVCREGRVEGVEVRDVATGEKMRARARVVANVAGPWADAIDVACGASEQAAMIRSKGIHIITRPLVRDHAVVLRTAEGHHFFIIPWRGHSLIGTTDTKYTGKPDVLRVTDEDIEELLQAMRDAYPSAGLTADDVLYRYVGVRPLVDQETQVYKASRKYEIVDYTGKGLKGYITAMGGKYTTSRNLARKVCNKVVAHLDRQAGECTTATTLLPGAVGGRFVDYVANAVEQHAALLPRDVIEQLVWTYGKRHEQVVELVQGDPALGQRLIEGRPEIPAQTVFAVEEEMALTLCDVIARRTGIGTLGDPGDEVLDRVLDAIAPRLGWDEDRRDREKRIYRDKVLGLPEPPLGGRYE